MKRVDENPPLAFPVDLKISEVNAPWRVLKLKPRQEKAMAFELIKMNIPYYLALITKVTRRRDNNKPRKSIIPLFPGYICYSWPTPLIRELYATGRVVNFIEIRNQNRFIRELEQIRCAIEHGIPLEPLNFEVKEGMTVEVRRGPLYGVRGIVVKLRNEQKLVLSVEGLGMALMTIDINEVKPVL